MYQKDGRIVERPNMITKERRQIFNPTEDMLKEAGFLPLTEEEEAAYLQSNTEQPPEDNSPTLAERLSAAEDAILTLMGVETDG